MKTKMLAIITLGSIGTLVGCSDSPTSPLQSSSAISDSPEQQRRSSSDEPFDKFAPREIRLAGSDETRAKAAPVTEPVVVKDDTVDTGKKAGGDKAVAAPAVGAKAKKDGSTESTTSAGGDKSGSGAGVGASLAKAKVVESSPDAGATVAAPITTAADIQVKQVSDVGLGAGDGSVTKTLPVVAADGSI